MQLILLHLCEHTVWFDFSAKSLSDLSFLSHLFTTTTTTITKLYYYYYLVIIVNTSLLWASEPVRPA